MELTEWRTLPMGLGNMEVPGKGLIANGAKFVDCSCNVVQGGVHCAGIPSDPLRLSTTRRSSGGISA